MDTAVLAKPSTGFGTFTAYGVIRVGDRDRAVQGVCRRSFLYHKAPNAGYPSYLSDHESCARRGAPCHQSGKIEKI
jgi:hypothetical protein